MFREVAFGDPEYDLPYLRAAHRGHFDGPDRVRSQTDFLERALDLAPGEKILDAGCGIGTYSHELTRRGYRTVGLDVSDTFLAEAERLRATSDTNPRFLKGDYRSLQLDETFSAVIITGTLFYRDFESLRTTCAQAYSVLEGGGKILFDHSNVAMQSERYPRVEWWRDEGASVLVRQDWDTDRRVVQIEWFRLDPFKQDYLYHSAELMCAEANQVMSVISSVGFLQVKLLAKWDLSGCPPAGSFRVFDERIDRGFVLVARK